MRRCRPVVTQDWIGEVWLRGNWKDKAAIVRAAKSDSLVHYNLSLRWMRIVPIAVALANLAIDAVDQMFRLILPRLLASRFYGIGLSWMN